jgi:galactonate dehydratase
MRITKVQTVSCEGGWRIHNFVKVSTDEGLVGWSECTAMRTAPMLTAAIRYLGSLIVGEDPMNTEAALLKLYGVTQRQLGGVAHQAISGLDAAMLDIKGKALGVPVYQLLGGKVRDRVRVYATHAGRELPLDPTLHPVRTLSDVPGAAARVVAQGFTAIKTGLGPVAAPLVRDEGGDISNAALDGVVPWIGAWQQALGRDVAIGLDVAFRFRMGGILKLARALEPFNVLWLEAESLDADVLRTVRSATRIPLCIGESFYRTEGFKSYLEAHALDVIMPDTVWNGISMGKKVADYANTYGAMFAPHNSHGALGGWQAVNLCATLPNFKILEYEFDDVPWRNDIVTDPIVVRDGSVPLPSKPGLGCEVNEDAVTEHPPEDRVR